MYTVVVNHQCQGNVTAVSRQYRGNVTAVSRQYQGSIRKGDKEALAEEGNAIRVLFRQYKVYWLQDLRDSLQGLS